MRYHEFRFRIPYDLYKKYKKTCIDLELSIPKQSTELIRKFLEVQEETKKLFNISKQEKEKK